MQDAKRPALTSPSGSRLDEGFLTQWCHPQQNERRVCCSRWDLESCLSVGPAEASERSPIGEGGGEHLFNDSSPHYYTGHTPLSPGSSVKLPGNLTEQGPR